jgi:hypothetical protein
MKRTRLIIIVSALLLFVLGITSSDFSFHGKPEGIYLLKGTDRKLIVLQDHLKLADYERLIARVEFEALYDRWRSKEKSAQGRPYLKYSWHAKKGSGYFISFLPDGTKFLVCLGRAIDAANNPVKGLFPGGGLLGSHYETAALKTNATGVVFFDGKEWQHLRHKADEALLSQADPSLRLEPGQWEFLGSRILFASQFHLALKSSHLAKVGAVPVSIDRYLIYHAGDHFFTLANRLTNLGTAPLGYHYSCGNEPSTRAISTPTGNSGWPEKKMPLLPGRAEIVVQTIGMLNNDLKNEPLCKPVVELASEELRFFLSR